MLGRTKWDPRDLLVALQIDLLQICYYNKDDCAVSSSKWQMMQDSALM